MTILLICSLLVSAVGVYIAYKAFKLRDEVKLLNRYQSDLVGKYEALKADFAGSSVYTDDNAGWLAETTPEDRNQPTVLFGASITRRFDAATLLPGKKLLNRGVGSQSDTQLLTRFSSDVLQLKPGRVVIKLCSGNFQPGIDTDAMNDALEMMALMAEKQGIRPMLATVIPATRAAEKFENYSVANQVSKFNERIKHFAKENDFTLVDYHAEMADRDGFLPDDQARDEIHPNEEGYQVMTEVLVHLFH